MLSKLCRGFGILLLSGSAAIPDTAGFFKTVESSLGDRLEISAFPDERAALHTVEACLFDETGGAAKGFDIRPDHPPRYTTRGLQPVCATLFTGLHQMVFWRWSHGRFQPIVSLPIDLSGHQNERLWITWRIDGALEAARQD